MKYTGSRKYSNTCSNIFYYFFVCSSISQACLYSTNLRTQFSKKKKKKKETASATRNLHFSFSTYFCGTSCCTSVSTHAGSPYIHLFGTNRKAANERESNTWKKKTTKEARLKSFYGQHSGSLWVVSNSRRSIWKHSVKTYPSKRMKLQSRIPGLLYYSFILSFSSSTVLPSIWKLAEGNWLKGKKALESPHSRCRSICGYNRFN